LAARNVHVMPTSRSSERRRVQIMGGGHGVRGERRKRRSITGFLFGGKGGEGKKKD
jgi:hypothetical protein